MAEGVALACEKMSIMDLKKASEFLSTLFGRSIDVCIIQQAEAGANRDSHYFAEASDGERCGFKAMEGTHTLHGADKEKMMWGLASLLEA